MVDLGTQGYPVIIFQWILFALVTPFVFVRLYVQLRFRHKPFREIFVIVAWLCYLEYTISDSLQNDWDEFNMAVDWDKKTDPQLAPIFKLAFISALVYKSILYACKAALLCLYGDITQRRTTLWWCVVAGWVAIAVGELFQILEVFLLCTPLSRNWTYSNLCMMDPHFWKIARPLSSTSWTLHIATDLLIYILPFFILRTLLNLEPHRKRAAQAMFALGFFNIVAAFLLYVYQVYFDTAEETSVNFIYAMEFLMPFQLGTAIIIVCVPYLRRLTKGTKAKDLRPELNTGNLAVHHRACGGDVESASASGGELGRVNSEGSAEDVKKAGEATLMEK